MAVKYICDLCGAEGAGRFTVGAAVRAPLTIPHSKLFDNEACRTCATKLWNELNDLLKSKIVISSSEQKDV